MLVNNNKKSVCFLIESPFPYYAGGIENWLYNVSLRLSPDTQVIVLSEKPYFFKESLYQLPESIIVRNYITIRRYKAIRMLMRLSLFYLLFSKWQVRNMRKCLTEAVEIYRVSTVIALNTMNAAAAVADVKKSNNSIFYVCSSRGPHADVISRNHQIISNTLHRLELQNMQKADVVWTNGFDMQDYYYKNYGIESTVMKNGVDIGKFTKETENPYPAGSNVIVSVATLIDIKCISELIEAFALVVKKGITNYSLFFVGKGDPTKYKELAVQLGVEDKIFFVGHKTDVRPYLQHANIITCLSGGGGFSMAALEAMTSCTPIVAWDTPVYRQFGRDTKTMELVPEKDVEQLAEGILRLINNKQEYSIMSQNAINEANKFDWRYIVDEISKTIR